MAASATSSESSSSSKRARIGSHLDHETPPRRKRAKEEEEEEEEEEEYQSLIPGLPDHLAQLCLAHLPPPLIFAVCRSWRRLLYAPSFPPFLSLYALLYADDEPNAVAFACFDPVAAAWVDLPPPPTPLLQQLPNPNPNSPNLGTPVVPLAAAPAPERGGGGAPGRAGGVDGGAAAGAAAAAGVPAAPGPAAVAPRAGAAAGAAAVVRRGGRPGRGRGLPGERRRPRPHDPALARSAALWHPRDGAWAPLPPLRDGRFSRDAAEAVGARGKLCMVNLRGRGPKQGAVLDLRRRAWEPMPPGMLAGWSGPVAAAAGDDDDDDAEAAMYVVDEGAGALRAYDWGGDRWETLLDAPELLRGAAQVAAGGGRVCVVTGCGGAVLVVDVSSSSPEPGTPTPPPRTWVVEPPPGKRVLAVHVLPRMGRPES
ncbi:F-box/kelch-repeat protein SKIP25 [Ananas comosus]|uniref:F-box/kelch-repeat protein SKIP25 n=1 Tax=Ananas comosus TaxID=4615 RepID=A0A199VQW0_ANACO|nr:F-box/kelch-repeat protein SKIP25 [Ananas comosus]